MDGQPVDAVKRSPSRGWSLTALLPFMAILVLAALLPLSGNNYWALIGTRAAIYWILVAGLNLIVGYAGQLAMWPCLRSAPTPPACSRQATSWHLCPRCSAWSRPAWWGQFSG
jgi:hypothetical protein